jgi:hypothetical protein
VACPNYSIIAASMIKPAFHIEREKASDDDLLQSLLLMEVNLHGFSYIVLQQVRQEILDARYYALPGPDGKSLPERLRYLIDEDEVLRSRFRQSTVLYNFADSLTVPEDSFDLEINRDLIELTYGAVSKGLVLSEKIPAHAAHNVYRIGPDIHALFQQKFTAGKYWHIYSLWLSSLKNFPPTISDGTSDVQLHAMFYPDKMLVSLYREGDLQLVQTFGYQVPEDAVYFLLNVCRQLECSPEEIALVVSGYVQDDSPLLTEIKKYFLHCSLDEVPPSFSGEAFAPLPAHFFSPLLKMALCV